MNTIKAADATNACFVKDLCKGWEDRGLGFHPHTVPKKAAPTESFLEHW